MITKPKRQTGAGNAGERWITHSQGWMKQRILPESEQNREWVPPESPITNHSNLACTCPNGNQRLATTIFTTIHSGLLSLKDGASAHTSAEYSQAHEYYHHFSIKFLNELCQACLRGSRWRNSVLPFPMRQTWRESTRGLSCIYCLFGSIFYYFNFIYVLFFSLTW